MLPRAVPSPLVLQGPSSLMSAAYKALVFYSQKAWQHSVLYEKVRTYIRKYKDEKIKSKAKLKILEGEEEVRRGGIIFLWQGKGGRGGERESVANERIRERKVKLIR